MGKVRINVDANMEMLASGQKYTKLKDGETIVWRMAPPMYEDGDYAGFIFWPVFKHFRLKNPADPQRGYATGDLKWHGNDEIGYEDYIMELAQVLLKHGNDAEKKIGDTIKGNQLNHAQGWVCGNKGKGKWSKLRYLPLSKTATADVMGLVKTQDDMDEPCLSDPDEGQAMILTRTGSGFQTKYNPQRTGKIEKLDDIIPDWRDQMHKTREELMSQMELNIHSREEQKKIAKISYPELDWDKLAAEHKL